MPGMLVLGVLGVLILVGVGSVEADVSLVLNEVVDFGEVGWILAFCA